MQALIIKLLQSRTPSLLLPFFPLSCQSNSLIGTTSFVVPQWYHELCGTRSHKLCGTMVVPQALWYQAPPALSDEPTIDPTYLSQIKSDLHKIFRVCSCGCPKMIQTKNKPFNKQTNKQKIKIFRS